MDREPGGKDNGVWWPRRNVVVQLAYFCECTPCSSYCTEMGFYTCNTISLLYFFDSKRIGMIVGTKKKVDFDGSGARWEGFLGVGGPEEI